jgi:hypothetical protein
MAWTIDEDRVMPFLAAPERRDLTQALSRPPAGRRPAAGTTAARPVMRSPAEVKKDAKEAKDYKERKDAKDNKDFKDGKDGKDHKDFKDGKDGKDRSDWSGGPPQVTPRAERPVAADVPETGGPQPAPVPGAHRTPTAEEGEDVLSVLRASRATRFLRGRGLVI